MIRHTVFLLLVVFCYMQAILAQSELPVEAKIYTNTSVINCNYSQLTITVEFNQQMKETDDNIISFPNLDANDFLIPLNNRGWMLLPSNNGDNEDVSFYYIDYIARRNDYVAPQWVNVKLSNVMNLNDVPFAEEYTDIFWVEAIPPVVDAEVQSPKCSGVDNGEIILNMVEGVAPFSFVWTKDDEPFTDGVNEHVATALAVGKYNVMITGHDKCWSMYEYTLEYPDSIVLTATVNHHLERRMDGEISVSVEGGTPPYTFYINDMNEGDKTLFSQLDSGIYTVRAVDDNLCEAVATLSIKNYQTPTIFTPDGDDINDIFMEGHKMDIFDRNGTLIYSGDEGWDGYYKGQPARPAIYFYIVYFPDGHLKKGSIQIYKK